MYLAMEIVTDRHTFLLNYVWIIGKYIPVYSSCAFLTDFLRQISNLGLNFVVQYCAFLPHVYELYVFQII